MKNNDTKIHVKGAVPWVFCPLLGQTCAAMPTFANLINFRIHLEREVTILRILGNNIRENLKKSEALLFSVDVAIRSASSINGWDGHQQFTTAVIYNRTAEK